MHSRGKWFLVPTLSLLGGCFVAYGYNDFDKKGAGGAGGAGTNAVTGTSSNASSSGSGGSGGSESCSDVVCNNRSQDCPITNCLPLNWARRAGNTQQEQMALSVAISPMSPHDVAIAGFYRNAEFPLDISTMTPIVAGASQAGTFTEGFIALYNGSTGKPVWGRFMQAPTGSPSSYREARSIAFDDEGSIIVAGVEGVGAGQHFIVQKYPPSSANAADPVWTVATFANEPTRTEAIAVAVFGTDIYLLGASYGSSSNIVCKAPNTTQLQPGLFVAKFNRDKECLWLHAMDAANISNITPTAITTARVATNEVWITGAINNNLSVGGTQSLSLFTTISGTPFVIRLKADNGDPDAAYAYKPNVGGTIKPLAIDANSLGNLYISGTAAGIAGLQPSFPDMAKGAFVARIEPSPDLKKPYESTLYTAVLPASGAGTFGAQATGASLVGDTLYVTGTMAGTVTLPDSGLTARSEDAIGNAVATPFLARFNATPSSVPTLQTLSVFSGGGAAYSDTYVAINARKSSAGNKDIVALAGNWAQSLDFTTYDKQVSNVLTSMADSMNADAFVAKFSPP